MSDIQAGDVVVCINAGTIVREGYDAHGKGLKLGAVYRVLDIELDEDDAAPCVVVGQPRAFSTYLAERFRKVRPAEDEFTELVRKMRPIKIPVQS